MHHIKVQNGYMLRLEKGEELISTIIEFAKDMQIQSAHFQAIGAVSSIEVGYYHLGKKEYSTDTINRDLEIASLTGNITYFENELTVHAHGVFSDERYATLGGHVSKATVSATCEVFVSYFNTKIDRKVNDDIGLKLMDL